MKFPEFDLQNPLLALYLPSIFTEYHILMESMIAIVGVHDGNIAMEMYAQFLFSFLPIEEREIIHAIFVSDPKRFQVAVTLESRYRLESVLSYFSDSEEWRALLKKHQQK